MAFVFYDTETTGKDTYFDQILQFAAIKADNDLNPMETFNIRYRLLPHVVPSPGALLAASVSIAGRLSHFEMMRQVRAKMNDWCREGHSRSPMPQTSLTNLVKQCAVTKDSNSRT